MPCKTIYFAALREVRGCRNNGAFDLTIKSFACVRSLKSLKETKININEDLQTDLYLK